MTDARFCASGYALIIQENDERKLLSKRKTIAPVAFGSRVVSPAQLKKSTYLQRIPGRAFTTPFSNISISHGKRRTDRQQISQRIFPNENHATRTMECTPCDYVLQFKFRIVHVAGYQNTAADFLSRLEDTRRYTNGADSGQPSIDRRRR